MSRRRSYPRSRNRGLIIDRNGVVLATNYSAYTLEITRAKLKGELDAEIGRAHV